MKKLKRQKAYLLFALILSAFITLPGCSGSEAGGGEWDTPVSTTTPGTPAIAPSVTAVVPLANATAVPINTKVITAAFSRAMEPTTLTITTFKLSCNGTPVTGGGAVTYLAAGNVATLPLPVATDLPIVAACTATITTGARDTLGTALAQNYVWNFTTGTAADTIRPTVTLTEPVTSTPGPTLDVPANTAITAVFSEDMDPATITDVLTFTLRDSTATPVVGMAIPVTYNAASRTATFRPLNTLITGETYTATILGTGVHAATDVATNALAGDPLLPLVANDYSWQFTTTVPALPQPVTVNDLSIAPSGGAIDVCPSTTIEATFNVPSGLKMDPDTLTTDTFLVTQPGPAPDFIPVPVLAQSVALDTLLTGKVATFTPLNPLVEGTLYTVTIIGGPLGVKDLAIPTANVMTNDYTWDFTAGPATGVCRPPVNLGLATTFGIASTAGITNTTTLPISHINGDVVFNPNATCNAVDILFADGPGFGLCGSNGSTPEIIGTVITPLYPDAITAQPITDALRAVYNSLTPGQLPNGTPIPDGTDLGRLAGIEVLNKSLFYPGVYTSINSIMITGELILDAQGDANAEFVFQSNSTIGTAATIPTTKIVLRNGAKASNVWWQAGSAATLQTGTVWYGNLLAYADVTMNTGASSCGRMFAGAFTDGAFVLSSNLVSVPGHPDAPAGCE